MVGRVVKPELNLGPERQVDILPQHMRKLKIRNDGTFLKTTPFR
jgi:hypothetical protein